MGMWGASSNKPCESVKVGISMLVSLSIWSLLSVLLDKAYGFLFVILMAVVRTNNRVTNALELRNGEFTEETACWCLLGQVMTCLFCGTSWIEIFLEKIEK